MPGRAAGFRVYPVRYGSAHCGLIFSRAWRRWAVRLISLLSLTALACWAGAGCAGSGGAATPGESRQTTVTVFAAASLTDAFRDIARAYNEEYPRSRIKLNLDGSQRLRSQLEHGASANVFASADWEQMEKLQRSGLVVGEPVNFASNQLVFLVNAEFDRRSVASATAEGTAATGNSSSVERIWLLAEPGVKVIAALPEVPAGRYSEAMLARMGGSSEFGRDIGEGIRANIVSREINVRSVAQKVALGEADAGITYGTDALPDYVAQRVRILEIPDSIRITAQYPVAVVSPSAETAKFMDFLLSDKGRQTLQEHGFGEPSNAARSFE